MFSPLMYAAVTNNRRAVLLLKEVFLCSSCPRTGIGALMMALRMGYTDIADLLLDEEKMYTNLKVSPFVAAISGGAFRYAVEHFSYQKDDYDSGGKSPLLQAVVSNDLEAFSFLRYQAKSCEGESWTPLQAAAYYGNAHLVVQLLPY